MEAKDRFKSAILEQNCRSTGDQDKEVESETSDECFDFYGQLIEERFRDINASHLAQCFVALGTVTTSPKTLDSVMVYNIPTSMVKVIRNRDQLTLQNIIDDQYERGYCDALSRCKRTIDTNDVVWPRNFP